MRRTVLVVGALVLVASCSGTLPVSSDTEAGTGTSAVPEQVEERPGVESAHRDDRRSARESDPQPERRERSRPAARETQPQKDAPVETKRRERRAHEPQTNRVRRYAVLDVVDGDTVKVAYRGSEVSVRVIGIDTPETVHPSEPVECGGPQASATATELLSGRQVRLVFDPSQGRVDSYGRMLAYVEAPGVGDFGLAMIRRGRAAEYTYDTSYARQTRYQAAEAGARTHGRGVWAECGGVEAPLRTEAQPAPQPLVHRGGGAGGGNCDPGYDPCVPPYPPDIDCGDVDGPVRVLGDDPHGFDADGDGIGCDS
ncbi:MAG TPA: thermonuclease family protein [Nocardioidaceae bacterium]|nr:thermonuclease family protein [Nocardioidaceae bacterium]